jgi:hypothetical protein
VGTSPRFLAAVAATDFAPRYYELCRRHPLRLDVAACKAPAADILRAARGAGPATKTKSRWIALTYLTVGRTGCPNWGASEASGAGVIRERSSSYETVWPLINKPAPQ